MKIGKPEQNRRCRRRGVPAVRSAFYDLFEPEEAEALDVRATLLRELEQWVARTDMNQRKAAKLLGVAKAQVVELKAGKISRFSLDLLFRLAVRAGLRPEVRIANQSRVEIK